MSTPDYPPLERLHARHWRLPTAPAPRWLQFVLSSIVLFFCLFPLFIGLMAFFWIPQISPWSALWSLLLCWSVAFYFLRVFLWNSFGAEEWLLGESQLHYRLNYRLFRSAPKSFPLKALQTSLVSWLSDPPGHAHLVLGGESLSIESHQSQPMENWRELRAAIAQAQQAEASGA